MGTFQGCLMITTLLISKDNNPTNLYCMSESLLEG